MKRLKTKISLIIVTTLTLSSYLQSAEFQKSHPLPPPLLSEENDGVCSLLSETIPVYSYKITNTYPHDSEAFTQGLVAHDGFLYEGTGIRRRSTIRKTELSTGDVLQSHTLPDSLFGEGITIFGNELIQLTWRSGTGFVYDKRRFVLLRTFHYTTEGWGITHDGKRLIMSDGTAVLYFLNPETFAVTGKVTVRDNKGPVTMLNELEYIRGDIYANVWRTHTIAIIDPETGRVRGWIDLEGLSRDAHGDTTLKTLNGIAYDEKTNRLFVTGKLWPKTYEIELVLPGR
jgi:glutamine cyclotransferase